MFTNPPIRNCGGKAFYKQSKLILESQKFDKTLNHQYQISNETHKNCLSSSIIQFANNLTVIAEIVNQDGRHSLRPTNVI